MRRLILLACAGLALAGCNKKQDNDGDTTSFTTNQATISVDAIRVQGATDEESAEKARQGWERTGEYRAIIVSVSPGEVQETDRFLVIAQRK